MIEIGAARKLQSNHAVGKDVTIDAEGIRRFDRKSWVPAKEEVAKLEIFENEHCGMGGHTGHKGTGSCVRTPFCWSGMKANVMEFVQPCLNGIILRTGDLIPRPLSKALHGKHQN